MSKENNTRSGCKDVFRAFLVKNATYEGYLEIPCIKKTEEIPNRLIPFSKAVGSHDYDAWVHFYEDDVSFERLWNQPSKYLPILKKFKGVITPDFSVYRDMPLEYSRVKSENGGYERLYSHSRKYYLLSGVGTNGYIISAYPIGEKEALTLIGRYGK